MKYTALLLVIFLEVHLALPLMEEASNPLGFVAFMVVAQVAGILKYMVWTE